MHYKPLLHELPCLCNVQCAENQDVCQKWIKNIRMMISILIHIITILNTCHKIRHTNVAELFLFFHDPFWLFL